MSKRGLNKVLFLLFHFVPENEFKNLLMNIYSIESYHFCSYNNYLSLLVALIGRHLGVPFAKNLRITSK